MSWALIALAAAMAIFSCSENRITRRIDYSVRFRESLTLFAVNTVGRCKRNPVVI